jgi:hypothetical protein
MIMVQPLVGFNFDPPRGLDFAPVSLWRQQSCNKCRTPGNPEVGTKQRDTASSVVSISRVMSDIGRMNANSPKNHGDQTMLIVCTRGQLGTSGEMLDRKSVQHSRRHCEVFPAAAEFAPLGALECQLPVVLGCDRDHQDLPAGADDVIRSRQIPLSDVTPSNEPHGALVEIGLRDFNQLYDICGHCSGPDSPPRHRHSNAPEGSLL